MRSRLVSTRISFCGLFLLILTLVRQSLTQETPGPVYPDGSIRLVGGRNPTEGNVEIFYRGRWGTICDDEWDIREAYIVCKMLGYNRAIRATFNSQFGRGRDLIWMDDLFCTGREFRLDRCRFEGWGVHDCNHAEAAGVVCDGQRGRSIQHRVSGNTVNSRAEPPTKPPKKAIRLVTEQSIPVKLIGGRTVVEGRVEVHLGTHGTGLICGDGWGLNEAIVVCRQLGYGHASNAVQTGSFGGSHSDIILSGVKCSGTENNLADCLHDKIGDAFCPGETNIAGVVCVTRLPDLVIDEKEIEKSSYLHAKPMSELKCAFEEKCLSTSAQEIMLRPGWQASYRNVLRFTARIGNFGTADFLPNVHKSDWKWHHCHMHYHSMEVFAHFDLIDARGNKVAEGHKASFCLEDNECHTNIHKKYACANHGDQGISVGCVDTYYHNIDCQWVDITDVRPGTYYLKVSVNPQFKVPELSYENNAATCIVHFDLVSAQVYNCTLGRP